MEFFEVLRKRRSIRNFKREKIPKEVVGLILKAAFLSPSSHNRRPWEFIVIDDKRILKQLSKAKPGVEPLAGASLAIAIIADERKSDVWLEDASIVAEHIHLATFALGLGSVWIQIMKRKTFEGEDSEEYVRKILGIPSHLRVPFIIAIGFPGEKKPPHGEEVFEWWKVHHNFYGRRWNGNIKS
ncbi:nitroreductase family protein [Pyrococcus sp. ST04]|uniref:nitroreductase family protein n=1 Tax=Pyrococcus sp. ST04 TaxID=1183377 RepID=UPI0002605B7E|nr:nitroreductase family protein [Pyrococcus sp. ST04]AFK22866.1 putative NAD(P)H oxidase [Pyrococcus sp. ST04]